MSNDQPRLHPRPRERQQRLPYQGSVRLLLAFAPWRLVLTLRGLNLSASGVCAQLPTPRADEDDLGREAEALLVEGEPYDLQLDHDTEHLPAPLLQARLVRRARTNAGWEMAFHFTTQDSSLLGLVHELGHANGANS